MYLVQIVTHWFFVKLFLVLFCLSIRIVNNDSVKGDPEEKHKNKLLETHCIDNELNIPQRCYPNQSLANTFNKIEKTIINPCPSGFIQKENICILTIKTTYPPNCPYTESLPFDSYIQYVDTFPIWLPVVREKSIYGEGLFYWSEISSNYKTYFNKPYIYEGTLLDKKCLVYYNESCIEAVSCEETHLAVCAYNILSKRRNDYCSQVFGSNCKQSDYSTNSKCFCQTEEIGTDDKKIELLEPYQNLLFSDITENCNIGLEKSNDKYFWKYSNIPVAYNYWSEDVEFGDDLIFGVMSPDGWLLKRTESGCTLIEKQLPILDKNEDLSLILYQQDDSSMFAIPKDISFWKQDESNNPLLFCFTDASNNTIIERIETNVVVVDNQKGVKFTLLNNGPGNYWCEGFTYPDLRVKKSNIFHQEYQYPEFVAIVTTRYTDTNNPLTQDFIQDKLLELNNVFQKMEDKFPDITNVYPRIYKIVEIDESISTIILNIHLTSIVDMDQFKFYPNIRQALLLINTYTDSFLVYDLWFADLCIGIQMIVDANTTYTWGASKIGTILMKPRQGWCIAEDGTVVTRHCEGNFIDGGTWAEMNTTCSSSNISTTTMLEKLQATNNFNLYIPFITELILNTTSLETIDINLIAEFLKKLCNEKQGINISEFADLMESLLNVDKDILKQSQLEYNSTDQILFYIHQIIGQSDFQNEVIRDSFTIISLAIDDFYSNSIFWNKVDDTRNIMYVNLTDDLELISYIDFHSGLILNKDLLIDVVNVSNSRIIILAFFKDSLFNEDYIQRNSSAIFSILLPNLYVNINDLEDLLITVYKVEEGHNPDDFICSYWSRDIDDEKGYWYHLNATQLIDSTVLCKFKESMNVALVVNINITERLSEILSQGIESCTSDLEVMETLLKRYPKHFNVDDLLLVNEILSKCSSSQTINQAADIFDRLMEWDPTVLVDKVRPKLLETFNKIFVMNDLSIGYYHRKNFVVAFTEDVEKPQTFFVPVCVAHCNMMFNRDNDNQAETEIKFTATITDKLTTNFLIEKFTFILMATNTFFLSQPYDTMETSKLIGFFINSDPVDHSHGKVEVELDFDIMGDWQAQTCETWSVDHWYSLNSIDVKVPGIYHCTYWTTGYYSLHYYSSTLNVTYLLEETIKNNLKTLMILEGLRTITLKHQKLFNTVDIGLIANYLLTIENADESILVSVTDLIATILEFSKTFLAQAEKEYQSNGKILQALTKIAASVENVNICNPKFAIIRTKIENQSVSGVILNDPNYPWNYTIIDEEPQNDFKYGIKLNEININEIREVEKVPELIYLLFFNTSLFYTDEGNTISSIIFGLFVINFENYFMNSIDVYFSENPSSLNCSYWTEMGKSRFIPLLSNHVRSSSICQYYRQGYFGLEKNGLNITMSLLRIINSEDKTTEKLKSLNQLLTHYADFAPIDVSLLADCLLKLNSLSIEDLNILKKIAEYVFSIATKTKQESQIKYNSINKMLQFINQMESYFDFNNPVVIQNYIKSIKCNVKESRYEITILNDTMDCYTKPGGDSYIEVHYIQRAATPTFNFIIEFPANDLFIDKDSSNTSNVLGITTNDTVSAMVFNVIFIHKAINLPKYVCSLWEQIQYDQGRWNYILTQQNIDSTICTISTVKSIQYVALVQLNLTQILDSILNSAEPYYNKIFDVLQILPAYRNKFEAHNINQVAAVLHLKLALNEIELEVMVGIINEIMKVNKEVLAASQATEDLLNCIDNLAKHYEGEALIIDFPNFALIIKPFVSRIIFNQTEDLSYLVENIIYNEDNSKYCRSSTALNIVNYNKQSPKLYISIYFNNALFNAKNNNNLRDKGIIVSVDVADRSQASSMRIYFDNFQNQSNVCAYWNHESSNQEQSGYWETVAKYPCENRLDLKYFALLEEYNVTSDLEEIMKSNKSIDDKLIDVSNVISNNTENLAPWDILLISQILGLLCDLNVTSRSQLHLTSQIVSDLFTIDRNILDQSQLLYNATDRLLFTIDEALKKCDEEIKVPIVHSNFTLAKSDIKDGNFTSLIFNDCSTTSCNISYLNNESFVDFIINAKFKTALLFSDEVLMQIQENDGPVDLLVTLHNHDNLFNEHPKRDMETTHVIGITLEGLKNKLEGNIYFLYNINNLKWYENRSCAYWKYEVSDTPIPGFWQNDLNPTSQSGYIICEYNHLTHFVLLLAGSSRSIQQLNDSQILDIITNINSVLSLFGLFGILLTAVLFDRWRNNTGNQILINFSVAISIKNVMLYISAGVYMEGNKSMGCTITGGILHYSILSEFCWMLIIAILQFKRFVEVLGGPLKYVLLKACICGWVFPALPVFLIIIIDVNNYNKSELGLCYPSHYGLYLGIWLPLAVIVSINFVIFVFILYNVFHKKTEYRDQTNHEILFQWRLAILLFSMLGLTWSFGFLCLVLSSAIFAVLFCFMATLQGFIMFLFFIVFNKNTRYLYVQCFRSWMYTKGYKDRLK